MSETWSRRLLYFAGAWNILGGAGALADPTRHIARFYGAALSVDEPLPAFFFRGVWINVIAWGVGYVLAARFPAGRAPILLAGAAGKLAYFAACVSLFSSGVGNGWVLASGVLDAAFAAFFLYVLRLQRTVGPATART